MTVYGTGTVNTDQPASDQLLRTRDLQNLNCETLNFYEWWSDNQLIGHLNMRPLVDHILCMNSTVAFQEENILSAICQGDSGGPLVHKDKLFGIVSYNSPPCDQ